MKAVVEYEIDQDFIKEYLETSKNSTVRELVNFIILAGLDTANKNSVGLRSVTYIIKKVGP